MPQNNPILAAEFSRVETGQPLNALDISKYQLPGPTSAGDQSWQEALRNAHAQLEHQRLRSMSVILLAHSILRYALDTPILLCSRHMVQTRGA